MNDEVTREFQMVSFILAATILEVPDDENAAAGLVGAVKGVIVPQGKGS